MDRLRITLVIQGKPIPQPRPRVTRFGAYVPKDHKIHAYRNAVAAAAKSNGMKPTEDAVAVTCRFTFARPKAHMTKDGLKDDAPRFLRCDGDNLAKGVLDALTGIAWIDDCQVVELHISKRYGPKDLTEIEIETCTP